MFRTLRWSVHGVAVALNRNVASRALYKLDDRTLKDIGLHRSEIWSALHNRIYYSNN